MNYRSEITSIELNFFLKNYIQKYYAFKQQKIRPETQVYKKILSETKFAETIYD